MKKVSIILLSLMLIIAMTACDPKMEQKSCIHVIETENATAYFDEAKKYPSAGICSKCGETVTLEGISVSTSDELLAVAADINSKTSIGTDLINIANDIDMTDETWTPFIIGKETDSIKTLTIDGNGYTISHLKTEDSDGSLTGIGFIGEIWNTGVNLEVQNLTLANANFTANTSSYVGGFAGYVESAPSVKFINCHLEKSIINSQDYAGGIYAWGSANAESTVLIENCTIHVCEISAEGSVGGIVGHASANSNVTLLIKNSSVTDSEIECTELLRQDKAGNIIGTVNCAKTEITNVTFTGNTVKSFGKEIDRYVGRTSFADGGSLTIDGRNVTEAE